mmetsp:Transcript_5542/g.13701  ORF Transcript_5542/g.13701 Transcript_5542/m.13701 type:complete len:201 (+) Transcript_5542:799-1401(+)
MAIVTTAERAKEGGLVLDRRLQAQVIANATAAATTVLVAALFLFAAPDGQVVVAKGVGIVALLQHHAPPPVFRHLFVPFLEGLPKALVGENGVHKWFLRIVGSEGGRNLRGSHGRGRAAVLFLASLAFCWDLGLCSGVRGRFRICCCSGWIRTCIRFTSFVTIFVAIAIVVLRIIVGCQLESGIAVIQTELPNGLAGNNI